MLEVQKELQAGRSDQGHVLLLQAGRPKSNTVKPSLLVVFKGAQRCLKY